MRAENWRPDPQLFGCLAKPGAAIGRPADDPNKRKDSLAATLSIVATANRRSESAD